MKCIIVDDEPIARRGIEKLTGQIPSLDILGSFENAEAAAGFMQDNEVDLVFLDIQMPGVNGIDFARSIPKTTLVIFTTAYAEFALDSYDVEAIDYLVKPIEAGRLKRAVDKAASYHEMLLSEERRKQAGQADAEYIFIKSDRKFFKANFKDVLFIEGLKDYVIIQTDKQRLITHLNLKTIHDMLPKQVFLRVSRSFIVNKERIDSFDNNDIFLGQYEISIGNFYRDSFFDEVMKKPPNHPGK
ncbi:MAG: LytTR family DNA-binding domain-containing protein [Tannerellaceae bacterium]|jgi:DNA-binding LytR/AlgR family response regulator|nr:LytTR family DNA-binding domain-containing protein [Tannerellaceae bacterium]